MASTTATQAIPPAKSSFYADSTPPICSLNIAAPFSALTPQEKLYAHHLSKACWNSAHIIATQTTFHASSLLSFFLTVFSSVSSSTTLADLGALKAKSGITEQGWKDLLDYAAQVFSNLGNFKSFGGTKFIPRVEEREFELVVKACERNEEAGAMWDQLKSEIYATLPTSKMTIGKPIDGHLSSYYPSSEFGLSPTDEDVANVQSLCDKNGVSTLNTRLSKTSATTFILHLASTTLSVPSSYPSTLTSSSPNLTITLQPGDYAAHLTRVCASLVEAAKHAGDENRALMLGEYEKSFRTGEIEAHKEGSRRWVRDVGPVVENYIGFIEDYVDPYGGRAEFEGFVAIVNKEQSKRFNTLVDAAPELIKTLPWGPDFELAKFNRPDFTALEILGFATSGIPAGINIPNYHDVREKHGFKNVSLSNILSAKAAGEKITFVAPEEVEAFEKWSDHAFEVQVANHELIGHGTGKQFQENEDGTFNFDRNLINPLTGKPIESWYKPGETYSTKIGAVSSSMEECRAEAVALFMSSNRDILSIFGFEDDQAANDLTYFTFVVMVRAGVRAMEWYDPSTGKHGQAHMEARLGITNWLIDHSLVSLEEIRSPATGELTDVYVRVDREKVLKEGKDVMGKLLVEIQVRKATGDAKGATEFYKSLTKPSEKWIKELRPLVIEKKLPRKIFVQPNTVLSAEGNDVELREYPVSVEGVIQSFVERGI